MPNTPVCPHSNWQMALLMPLLIPVHISTHTSVSISPSITTNAAPSLWKLLKEDDTWSKSNCIKIPQMCMFSQWVATVWYIPLTLGQCHRLQATKAGLNIYISQMENKEAAAPVPFKEEARRSSCLLAWLAAHYITGEACIPACCY